MVEEVMEGLEVNRSLPLDRRSSCCRERTVGVSRTCRHQSSSLARLRAIMKGVDEWGGMDE